MEGASQLLLVVLCATSGWSVALVAFLCPHSLVPCKPRPSRISPTPIIGSCTKGWESYTQSLRAQAPHSRLPDCPSFPYGPRFDPFRTAPNLVLSLSFCLAANNSLLGGGGGEYTDLPGSPVRLE